MISQLVLALTLVASLLSCAAATTIVKRDVLTDAEDAVMILNAILFNTFYTALCAVRKVYFSAQPNNLKLILNFDKYYPIEHIFVPACSSARKIHFFKF